MMLGGNAYCPRCGALVWVELPVVSATITTHGLLIEVPHGKTVKHTCGEPDTWAHVPPQDER